MESVVRVGLVPALVPVEPGLGFMVEASGIGVGQSGVWNLSFELVLCRHWFP